MRQRATATTRPAHARAASLPGQQNARRSKANELDGWQREKPSISAFGLQAKLVVGDANDPLEQEADRMSDQVMRVPEARLQRQQNNEEDEEETLQRKPTLQRKASSATASQMAAPPSVHKALQEPGSPIASGHRTFFEPRFGHDFSGVRIHTGPQAEKSAREVNARAYTVGHHIVFSHQQYNPDSVSGKRLLAHELTHTLQQRGQRHAAVLRRDTITDVRDKLSYGFADWAITDEEATDSLALLTTIAPAKLPTELARLGNKYVTRLLDNLPDAAKSGAAYQNLITALGSSGVADYATDQLSYSLFDWGVSSDEVARVFNLFTNLSAPEREKLLSKLASTSRLDRLLRNTSYGHYTLHLLPWMKGLSKGHLSNDQRKILRKIVKHAPISPTDILKAATEIRYDVSVGKTTIADRTPVAWDGKKLRDTYLALDHLPDAHVARNKMLNRFGQFSKPSHKLANGQTATVAGTFSQSKKELAANVKAKGDIAGTLIHETGHAVDAEMGWSKGSEPAKHSRGGWKEYPNHKLCATDMVNDANTSIKKDLSATQRTDVISDMAKAMANRSVSRLAPDIRARPWFAGLSKKIKTSVLQDKSLAAIPIGLKSPWFTAENGGEHLGNHVYQESYTPTWVRYRHEARKRLVAEYQFRDAGEWFAECYAAYYDPDNKQKGDRLKKVDPNTKVYFDTHVDVRAPSR